MANFQFKKCIFKACRCNSILMCLQLNTETPNAKVSFLPNELLGWGGLLDAAHIPITLHLGGFEFWNTIKEDKNMATVGWLWLSFKNNKKQQNTHFLKLCSACTVAQQ